MQTIPMCISTHQIEINYKTVSTHQIEINYKTVYRPPDKSGSKIMCSGKVSTKTTIKIECPLNL